MNFRNPSLLICGLFVLGLSVTGCKKTPPTGIRKVSFLLTNDIHGHLEPSRLKSGAMAGGMAYLGGIVDSIRTQPEYVAGNAGFFVLDSGDQFQGTLLSNYNEGSAIFEAMNEVGYDAVVPGNHDYDFGPIGWLYDKVTKNQTNENPREVIEGLAKKANFPLLSANTYYKNSVRFAGSTAPLTLDSQCLLKDGTAKGPLDFTGATRPAFLKPYRIIEKADVRVALIGLDHHATASNTTIENVDDLCFRDEVETYLEIRKELEGKADVFVLMMHNGNSDNAKEGSKIVESINGKYPNGVHLVAAGHTHFVHDDIVNGVHIMQDGSENVNIGRVDLFFDFDRNEVKSAATVSRAGILMEHSACNQSAGDFCKQYPTPIIPKASISTIVDKAEQEVAPISSQFLGEAKEQITRNRINESAMSNVLTDALREATQTDISFMNTGGIRTDFQKGPILYRDLFEVLPFSNRAVIMASVPWSVIKKVLAKSIQTCGRYGALMQSGLKVQFIRTCVPETDIDAKASLVRVETVGGKLLFDAASNFELSPNETLSVGTLDFLAAGGSGYEDFKEGTVNFTLGIAREIIVKAMVKSPPTLTNTVDNRMQNLK